MVEKCIRMMTTRPIAVITAAIIAKDHFEGQKKRKAIRDFFIEVKAPRCLFVLSLEVTTLGSKTNPKQTKCNEGQPKTSFAPSSATLSLQFVFFSHYS